MSTIHATTSNLLGSALLPPASQGLALTKPHFSGQSYLVPPQIPTDWDEKEFRDAIVEAMVEHGIAYQIRENRTRRKLSQAEFAVLIGTKQSAVHRLEDPLYGKYSIATLIKVAHAFDCGLTVRFVDHNEMAAQIDKTKPDDLFVRSFGELK